MSSLESSLPLAGLDEKSSGLLKFMGGIPELRREFLFELRSCATGDDNNSASSASCAEDAKSSTSELCPAGDDDPRNPDPRRVFSAESVDVVWSCACSMISQVCSVASGANDTRRFIIDLRRAAFASASSFDRIDLVAVVGMNADLRLSFDSRLGASGSSREPGPMLLLLPLRVVFFGESDIDRPFRASGSLVRVGATFSLLAADSMFVARLSRKSTLMIELEMSTMLVPFGARLAASTTR
jgi:hypothetical protein